ncbi:MAG: sulfotransferase [Acidobacteria bacterium]|nr:sulfotransferase [Acidobacteriota bacterium]
MPRRTWPIIIGGCLRSGTSLARRLLNAHPRIHCGPEVKFFRDFYNDYPEDPVRHLRFATSARRILAEEELLDILGGAFVRVHRQAAKRAGKVRWADKNPENVLYLSQWERLLGGKWLLVHVVRNPLDTLTSMLEAEFPKSLPPTLDGCVEFYERYVRAGHEFSLRFPKRSYCLAYEKLVREPESVLQEWMHWLGETISPAQWQLDHPAHQKGLEDPKISRTSRIHADSVRRWSDRLTSAQVTVVWERLGPLWLAAAEPAGAQADWLDL